MKKIFILSLLFIYTTVNASRVYLFNNNFNNDFKTYNDNYNYNDYILNQNQILIVPPENGIISNDIILNTNYRIIVLESSKNSHLKDLEYNDTTGSFTYNPSDNVVGEVIYKYYIEYDNNKSNESYIYFYVKNTSTSYTINYYENNNKIVPSVIKNTSVNSTITEKPIKLDGYKILNNNPITKKMNINKEENNFNFYYEKIPNTGI